MLISAQLVANEAVLSINNGIVARPKFAPATDSKSRIHQFPLVCREDRVFVVHPALESEAWLDEVASRIGCRPQYDACVERQREQSEYWHSADLCTKSDYRELLATQHFTTTEKIVSAVRSALGGVSIHSDGIFYVIAREVLQKIGIEEPDVGSDDELLDAVLKPEWRTRDVLELNAWQRVHAFERGVVKMSRGKVQAQGRAA